MTILELQRALNDLGAKPELKLDGKEGPKTTQAIKDFQRKNGLTPDGIIGKYTLAAIKNKLGDGVLHNIDVSRSSFAYLKKNSLVTTSKLKAKYGNPCDTNNLVTFELPKGFRFKYDDKDVTKITSHKSIKDKLIDVFTELLQVYGLDRLDELGITKYGGMYNCRQMRSSGAWSVHSWGLAIDLDPERNSLNTPFLQSQFSKIEYKEMHEIFYKHGFINLGIEADMDSMHFQIAE